jgi:hypothetical protein
VSFEVAPILNNKISLVVLLDGSDLVFENSTRSASSNQVHS